jgi:hypothetical protein
MSRFGLVKMSKWDQQPEAVRIQEALLSTMYRRDPSGIPLVEAGGTFNLQHRDQSGLWVATSVLREAQPIRSEKFVVTLPGGDDQVKALQIIWQRGELGVFVGTPYFSPLHALVGRMVVPPGPDGPVTISLRENAKVSREKVKMTFHRSGNVRFSATRRIEPIQTNVRPLRDKVGHLFTLHVRGSGALERVTAVDRAKRPEKELLIHFPIELSAGDAVKMVGRWYPQAMVIAARPDLDGHGPPGLAHLQVAEGALEDGVLIAPPPHGRGEATASS